ncbi:uncharacterized protein LOC123872600 isoform X1 [Maniola jurtina]|uniref:uncharacterized protein LOC123872600 isoform X1 n=1 Tax=Maniola jurtina TaxID=191418 RepID=UPI001E68A8CE|nr:uncharacterized protein LOC123872600 isoform X1 [Maniola jurtina]XP_045772933.1 uncharacterized protein LOC123872600 isoform X1 [Maniola jurtina]
MMHTVPILVMTLTAALAAPALDGASTGLTDEDYYSFEADRREIPEQIIILPQKRAALVLDRLLIALQKALHEESANHGLDAERDGPRTAPLRLANIEPNDVMGLQRRGQAAGRGRVLRCYFNAVTCF